MGSILRFRMDTKNYMVNDLRYMKIGFNAKKIGEKTLFVKKSMKDD